MITARVISSSSLSSRHYCHPHHQHPDCLTCTTYIIIPEPICAIGHGVGGLLSAKKDNGKSWSFKNYSMTAVSHESSLFLYSCQKSNAKNDCITKIRYFFFISHRF